MFILLKVLLFFFRPLVWIILLLLVSLLTKNIRWKKQCFIWALGLLIFFTNPWIINSILRQYETKPIVFTAPQKFSTGILLGGLISYNRMDDAGYFNGAADRFIQTALLYKKGIIDHIIIAAGNGYMTNNNFREGNYIKERLLELGIPTTAIYTDINSRNTLENAKYAKQIIDSVHLPGPYLLISSAMHLPRARLAFNKAGISVSLYPCDFSSRNVGNNFIEDYLLPSARALDKWDNFIKEIAGIIIYKSTAKG